MVLAFLLLGMTDEKIISSHWASPSLIGDGSQVKWENIVKMRDKKLNVNVAFMNDTNNLYILFVFIDPKYLSTIEATGLKILASVDGKKAKDFGIRFMKKNISVNEHISYPMQGKPLMKMRMLFNQLP